MLLSDFCHQLLRSPQLSDKLFFPESLEDDGVPGTYDFELPQREEAWGFSRHADKPMKLGFGEPEQAAALLLTLANHELLAIELMALALLRFPQAPRMFRRSLLLTLREEQEHCRLYLKRIDELGGAPQGAPLSRFFWDALRSCTSPRAFAAGMGLTLEQANLDFSLGLARQARAAGDLESAALLDRVRLDEIRHVRLGLAWLKRELPPGADLLAEHAALLSPPLSLARARGDQDFDLEGRRLAGLDEDYITGLRLAGGSRGRTPEVFFFNPQAELELAGAAPVSGPAADLRADLAPLLAAVAHREDILLVPRLPSLNDRERLAAAGLEVPEFVDENSLVDLAQRKLGRLRPWSFSPLAEAKLAPLRPAQNPRLHSPLWRDDWSPLFSKLRPENLDLAPLAEIPGLADEDALRRVIFRDEQLEAALADLRSTHQVERIVLKSPFGNAGAGQIRLDPGSLRPADAGWIKRVLKEQGGLVLEPWLPRLADFSAQFEAEPGRLRLIGLTRQLADLRGQYRGTLCGDLLRDLPDEAKRFLNPSGEALLPLAFKALASCLSPSLDRVGFTGPLGVDAFLYRQSDGALRLRVLCEINPRLTMGRLAFEILGRRGGVFRIERLRDDAARQELLAAESRGELRCLRDPFSCWAFCPVMAKYPDLGNSRSNTNGSF